MKSNDSMDQQCVTRTIYHCAEALRIVGILLQPFMPAKASQLLDLIGVDSARRTFQDAQYGIDSTFGEAKVPVGSGVYDTLFPPLLASTLCRI